MSELPITRERVEAFLFAEAALLDRWKLDAWLELFDPQEGAYLLPGTGTQSADPAAAVYFIADDMVRLRSRVAQLLGDAAWAESPPSRTRHLVTNVRLLGVEAGVARVEANFAVYRFRFETVDLYVGEYQYRLRAEGQDLKILERRATLDLEALRPQGKISIII